MYAYVQAFLQQILVSVACNGTHSLKERLRDVDPLDLVETIRDRARSDPLCEPLLLPHVRSRARAYSRAEAL